jgi:hypothetical protein
LDIVFAAAAWGVRGCRVQLFKHLSGMVREVGIANGVIPYDDLNSIGWKFSLDIPSFKSEIVSISIANQLTKYSTLQ